MDMTFEAFRQRLFALAYRVLLDRSDAEDVVQETYLRWHDADQANIDAPNAWLTTVASRLAIDRLRRKKSEHELYAALHVHEMDESRFSPSPENLLSITSDVTEAVRLLLQHLAPQERTALILHDVLDCPHEEIAGVLGKTIPNSRQILRRAKGRARDDRRVRDTDSSVPKELVQRFIGALQNQDREAMLNLIAEDAELIIDDGVSGPQAMTASGNRNPVAALMNNLMAPNLTAAVVLLSGHWHVVLMRQRQPIAVCYLQSGMYQIRSLHLLCSHEVLRLAQQAIDRQYSRSVRLLRTRMDVVCQEQEMEQSALVSC